MKTLKKLTAVIMTGIITSASCAAMNVNAAHSDPNGDGVININDAVVIMTYLANMKEPVSGLDAYDFDRNGVISEMDYQSVQMYLARQWAG